MSPADADAMRNPPTTIRLGARLRLEIRRRKEAQESLGLTKVAPRNPPQNGLLPRKTHESNEQGVGVPAPF